MKRTFYILLSSFLLLFLINTACNKEDTISQASPQPNTKPIVYAGQDQTIFLPASAVTLTGSATDAERNINSYVWKQVNGSATAKIEMPQSLTTRVSNLTIGKYEFELTVIDTRGAWGVDTVTVLVRDPNIPGQGEVVFSGLKWQCPMGCTVEIYCLSCYVPANKPFKVYIRESVLSPWLEVVPEAQWSNATRYVYGYHNDRFWVYSNDEPNNVPDVKLVY